MSFLSALLAFRQRMRPLPLFGRKKWIALKTGDHHVGTVNAPETLVIDDARRYAKNALLYGCFPILY